MKANELMIGDWFYLTPFDVEFPRPKKIIAINYHSYKGDDHCDWVDFDVWDEIGLDDIRPVPLTKEILELNGWKYEFDKTDYMVKYDLHIEGKNCWMMWAIKEHNLDIQRQDEKLDVYNLAIQRTVIPCDYVHELQHALRLCGIEKEIEL